MNDEQIKHMVNRFLSWRLPTNFEPDGGISFDPSIISVGPIGTNLLTATQAETMIRHMLIDLPSAQ